MEQKVRSFSYPWGSGYVAEEAKVREPHHVPTFQLLRYTDGPAAGEISIRFCHYNHEGRFQRSPLLMSVEEIEMMQQALLETPELRELLIRLVA